MKPITLTHWLAVLCIVSLLIGLPAQALGGTSMAVNTVGQLDKPMGASAPCDGCTTAETGSAECHSVYCSPPAINIVTDVTLADPANAPQHIAITHFHSSINPIPDPQPPRHRPTA